MQQRETDRGQTGGKERGAKDSLSSYKKRFDTNMHQTDVCVCVLLIGLL